MPLSIPAVILARCPRNSGTKWSEARSWLGGAPCLGAQPWPRGSGGQPMVFMAQIDLGELAECTGPSPLTAEGSLAFFISRNEKAYDECAVLHVDSAEPTAPPADAPPIIGHRSEEVFSQSNDLPFPQLFPRWPVELHALHALSDGDEWSKTQAVRARFGHSQFVASELVKSLKDGPAWWHSAQNLADGLAYAVANKQNRYKYADNWVASSEREMLKESTFMRIMVRLLGRSGRTSEDQLNRARAKRDELPEQFDRLSGFAQEVAGWAAEHEPFERMSDEDTERLRAGPEHVRREFRETASYFVPFTYGEMIAETIMALATADDTAYQTLPEPIRELIDAQLLIPPLGWHQMFGEGAAIQGNAAWENEGNVMLLQLFHDEMVRWRFNDGAYQFWIPPDDLAKRRWSAARLTFEAT